MNHAMAAPGVERSKPRQISLVKLVLILGALTAFNSMSIDMAFVGMFHNGTGLPMVMTMACCSVAGTIAVKCTRRSDSLPEETPQRNVQIIAA